MNALAELPALEKPGRPLARPHGIVIHHSLTRDSNTLSWDDIDRYHREVRGWDMIGYHAGIEVVDGVLVPLLGRPWNRTGAHTAGHNRRLGFLFVGNYDEITPTAETLHKAAMLVLAPWCQMFSIPVREIQPHWAYAEKSCPGKLFPVDELRRIIAGYL